jgi:hypothetical protein
MKRTSLAAHLSIPALVTLGAFATALRREPFGGEMFASYVLGGYLFYAAPHLLWAVIAALAKFSGAVWHAGFVASTIALAAIASLWLGPRDPSGLPLQWMLYWPLAIVLQLVIVGGTAIYCRAKKTPNIAFEKDAPKSARPSI